MPPDDQQRAQTIAQALTEVSERTTTIVHEQIELAKAEVSQKVNRLIKGAVIGAIAGLFAVFALSLLLQGVAWVFYDYVFNQIFVGFVIVAGALFLLGGLAGFLAARALKAGSPPTPDMAIEEARLIKETFEEPFHGDGRSQLPAGPDQGLPSGAAADRSDVPVPPAATPPVPPAPGSAAPGERR